MIGQWWDINASTEHWWARTFLKNGYEKLVFQEMQFNTEHNVNWVGTVYDFGLQEYHRNCKDQ